MRKRLLVQGRPLSYRFGCACLAAIIGVTSVAGVALLSQTEAAVIPPQGVYRAAAYPEGIDQYEAFVGHPVQYALEFQGEDSWKNLTYPNWQCDVWRQRTLILGSSLSFPGDWNRNFNGVKVGWAQAARGDYDEHWRQLGLNLVACGQANAILRGNHEFNGGWFKHRVEPAEAADFKIAWRRWVTILRATPGQNFKFDWNVSLMPDLYWDATTAYPGDDVVDYIGVDVYDMWYAKGWRPGIDPQPSRAERDAVWNHNLNGRYGLNFWRNFARSHSKPLSFPEWGIVYWRDGGDGLSHGGGDNASFVRRMAAIIKDPEWNVGYHAFWEHSTGKGTGVMNPDSGRAIPVSVSRTAFLDEFGGTANAYGSAPSTPPVKTGDLDRDGNVAITDLSILLSSWGRAGVAADLNGDGTVSITDLSILLSRWG